MGRLLVMFGYQLRAVLFHHAIIFIIGYYMNTSTSQKEKKSAHETEYSILKIFGLMKHCNVSLWSQSVPMQAYRPSDQWIHTILMFSIFFFIVFILPLLAKTDPENYIEKRQKKLGSNVRWLTNTKHKKSFIIIWIAMKMETNQIYDKCNGCLFVS